MWPKENKKKVSGAIRILQQKRDASARATHLMVKNDPLITYESGILGQAVIKKFFIATFLERKIMSTKTSFKRIALVAASALAIAGFSAVPANADAVTAAAIVKSISLANTTAAPTVGAAVVVNLGLKVWDLTGETDVDTLNIRSYLSTFPSGGFAQVSANATAVGADSEIGVDAQSADTVSGSSYIITFTDSSEMGAGETVTATAAIGIGKYSFTPAVAGTYTLQTWADSDGDGVVDIGEAVQTLSITVAAASGYSNSLSTLHSINTAGTAAADATTNLVALTGSSTMATATRGSLTIKLNDAAGVAMTTGNTITATMSGVGGLAAIATLAMTADVPSATDCSATVVARAISAAADAVNTISICSDGNSGVGTITVSVTNAAGTTTILGTKTITFYGAVTKIEATGVMTIAKAGGGTTGDAAAARNLATEIPAVIVKATDANGNLVTGLTISALSADITKINSAITIAEDVAATANIYSSGGSGYYNASVSTPSSAASGDSVVLTFRIADPADATGATFLTSPVTFTMGGTTVVTETLSLDSDSYTSGQAMVITRTALDSAGNKVADGTASPAVAFTKAVGGTAPVAGIYVGGISATSSTAPSVFAPTNSGDFSDYMTSGNAASSTITVAATVAADEQSSLALDAANAATDAAENAYDEAQNAT